MTTPTPNSSDQPHAVDETAAPAAAPEAPAVPAAPDAPAAAEATASSKKSVLPLLSIIFAGAAFLFAVMPPTAGLTWLLAVPAIVLAIIALVKKAQPKLLAIIAIILAPLAWLIAIIVVVATVASGIGNAIQSGGTSGDDDSPAVSAPAADEPVAEEGVATISGGDHVVGTDLAPGQYRAEVKKSIIALCTVTQQNGSDYLDVRNANEGSVIFTVQDVPGSVVSFSGCQNIALASDVVRANPSTITNGDWLVGAELAPGQYKGTVDTAAVIKLGTISQSGGSGIIDLTNGNEGSVIFTVQDVPGSVVSFSGLVDIQKIG